MRCMHGEILESLVHVQSRPLTGSFAYFSPLVMVALSVRCTKLLLRPSICIVQTTFDVYIAD
jgi:hypothetical protein